MGLSDAQRTRYARHLLLPELGEAGQLRLLAASARPEGSPDAGALAVARDYLSRAGLRVSGEASAVALELPDADAVARLAGAPELAEAARALAGAFAAVEAIKAAAGIGSRGALAPQFSLAAGAHERESEAV
jgi:sulfur-carrier protein adenylyltransferase/sulfurtransferase